MSEYLEPIVENFDPMDYMMPDEEEFDEMLPEDADDEDVLEARQSYKSQKERGGAILTDKILAELLYLSNNAREPIDKSKNSPVNEWHGEQKDDIHLFFAFMGQAQEHLLRDAFVTHVISEDATTEAMKQKIMSDDHGRAMSAWECLDYLHKAGFIDDGLKGETGQTRGERNETVHDITRWLFAQFDPHQIESEISRGERTVVRLLELVYDFDLE